MVIYKSDNTISKKQQTFIDLYSDKYPTHKLFVEYNVGELISKLEKIYGKEYDLIKKRRSKNLRFDIIDWTTFTAFEVQGGQHDSFNPFFHKELNSFQRQQKHDFLKKDICDFFGLDLQLIYNEENVDGY